MSKEQIISALDRIDNSVYTILDDKDLFIENRLCEATRTAWLNIGKDKIKELKEYVSKAEIEKNLNDAGLTDNFLKFKIDIINFLSKDLKKYARRILDCIKIFLTSLAYAITDSIIKMAIEILKEIIGFISNILK